MAGTVALGIGLVSAGISAGVSVVKTIDANNLASQTQQQQQQLLNEAQQQSQQQQDQSNLISQRTASEASLSGAAPKFNGSNTILTGPLGIPSGSSNAPKNLLGT